MKTVKDIHATKSTGELVDEMFEAGGFTAKHLGTAAKIVERMFREAEKGECVNFLSFPACIASTGTRGILTELVRKKRVQAIMTASGMLDYDLARLWRNYYHGSFQANDVELHRKGINRIGNIFAPLESYGIILEKKLQPMLAKIYKEKKEISTHELVWALGREIAKEKKAKESIIYWAWKNKIPVFIPGITDGAVGSQLFFFWQDHKDFVVNLFLDENKLAEIVFDAPKAGAIMIGGGISKHHTIWWNQFRGGLDYAVGITTAIEYDGSLSGARVREGISWGKIKENAKQVTVQGDATVLLPLLVSAVEEKLRTKSKL
ncbi:MAG: deoxyhypusine synthase [Candidatus Diapherotrites archaeon]|nr:deoxyhypusine synthase [Candidatus Diapherotrites archaeon]